MNYLRSRQACFIVPLPPNLLMFLQLLHLPQSGWRQTSHCPHLLLLAALPLSSISSYRHSSAYRPTLACSAFVLQTTCCQANDFPIIVSFIDETSEILIILLYAKVMVVCS